MKNPVYIVLLLLSIALIQVQGQEINGTLVSDCGCNGTSETVANLTVTVDVINATATVVGTVDATEGVFAFNYSGLDDGTYSVCINTSSTTYEVCECSNFTIASGVSIESNVTISVFDAFTSVDVPENITVPCGSSIDTNVTGSANFTDCSGTVELTTYNDTQSIEDCVITITRTWINPTTGENSTQTITIDDTAAPVFDVAPEDVTVDCENATVSFAEFLTTYGNASISDCGTFNVTNNYDSAIGLTCGGPNNITFTATDECGNSANATASFTYTDVTAPTLSANASDSSVECTSNSTDDFTAWIASNGGAVADDDCAANVTWTNDNTGSPSGCNASTTVTFTAADDCGNSVNTTATFTLTDTSAPVIDTPASDVEFDCGAGNQTAEEAFAAFLASYGGANATDACGSNVTWSSDNTEGFTAGCNASTSVTFTASDECGNTVNTTASFTVIDTSAPVIDTPASDVTFDCGSGNQTTEEAFAAFLASYGGANATDACGSNVTWSSDNTEGFTAGCNTSTSVTFTASDECGNTANTTASFTVVDTSAPVIDTPASDVEFDCGSGNQTTEDAFAAFLASYGGASATDACGSNVTWSSDNTEGFTAGCNTSTAVTFTASDECGNTVNTTASFIVVDTSAPVIDTPASDVTFDCGSGNQTTEEAFSAFLASYGGANATDACGSNVTWSSDNTEGFTAGCNTSTAVTFTASDECGNTANTTASFTVVDTSAPVIDTPASDVTFDCGSGNQTTEDAFAAFLSSYGGASATDACGSNVTWSSDNTEGFTAGCNTSTAVTFTASDECGNTANTTASFTVVDTSAPVIDTPASDVEFDCGAGNQTTEDAFAAFLASYGGASATDACGSNVTWSSDNTEGFTAGCNASTAVTFTASDECGNTANTTASFTVVDTSAPVIDTPASDVTFDCGSGNQTTEEAFAAFLDSYGGASATDACGSNVTWSSDNTETAPTSCNTPTTVTFTATDECGNSANTTASFTLSDSSAPEITSPATNTSVECATNSTSNADALNAYLAANGNALASDNCAANVSWTNDYNTSAEIPATCASDLTIVFSASDECGNTAQTTGVFSVIDSSAPVFSTAPQSITTDCNTDEESFADWLAANGEAVADDCNAIVWTNSFDSAENFTCGTETVTFTATDACGNAANATASFTITDTIAPVFISPPQDVTEQCDANPGAFSAWIAAGGNAVVTDNCDSAPVVSANASALVCNAAQTVEFTATDACGNTAVSFATYTCTCGVSSRVRIEDVRFVDQGSSVVRITANLTRPVLGGFVADVVLTIAQADSAVVFNETATLVFEGANHELRFVFFDLVSVSNVGEFSALITIENVRLSSSGSGYTINVVNSAFDYSFGQIVNGEVNYRIDANLYLKDARVANSGDKLRLTSVLKKADIALNVRFEVYLDGVYFGMKNMVFLQGNVIEGQSSNNVESNAYVQLPVASLTDGVVLTVAYRGYSNENVAFSSDSSFIVTSGQLVSLENYNAFLTVPLA